MSDVNSPSVVRVSPWVSRTLEPAGPDRELDPSEVLSEIHDSFSRWGAEHLLRADPFNDADAGPNLGDKAAGRSVDNRHR